jgi:membrane-bound lytic murein transglycosylase MltF
LLSWQIARIGFDSHFLFPRLRRVIRSLTRICPRGFHFVRRSKTVFAIFALASMGVSLAAPSEEVSEEVDVVDGALAPLVAEPFVGDLSGIRDRGFLRVLVTHSRTDFFVNDGKILGIQAELARELQKWLNKGIKREQDKLKLLFVPVTFDQLMPALEAGQGDVAAALLTITPGRSKRVDFISGKRQAVAEVLVTHASTTAPESIEALSGRSLTVLRGSSYVEHLRALNEQFAARGLEPIEVIEADPRLLSEDLLEMVNAGVIEATVIDDFKGRLWAQVLDDIRVHDDLAIKRGNHIGWAIRKDNPELKTSLDEFVSKVKRGSLLGNILFKRYFGNVRWISNPLDQQQRQSYRQYVDLFRKYGEQYDFDHLALFAQAFQESGLDHSRKSHRGAVGLMQLLPSTAKDKNVGIPDISDPESNVHAGTKYLAFLRDRYFSDPAMTETDRLAFTWAAYNAGPAKVRKMRELAVKLGLDPNQWFGHVEVAAGRIVGRETVKYVANIYKYYIAYRLISDLRSESGTS